MSSLEPLIEGHRPFVCARLSQYISPMDIGDGVGGLLNTGRLFSRWSLAFGAERHTAGSGWQTMIQPEVLSYLFNRLHSVKPDAKTFLDIGSGSGFVVAAANRMGYDAIGIERDEAVYREACECFRNEGCDPSRIIHGEFPPDESHENNLMERWWEKDVIYSYQPLEVLCSILKILASRISEHTLIVLPAWEDADSGEMAVTQLLKKRDISLRFVSSGLWGVQLVRA